MVFFADISNPATDALKDDYTPKIFTKIKTKAGSVGVTAETERKTKNESTSLLSKLAFKWAGPSGFSLDKLTLKPDGSHSLETSLTGIAPGLKFTFAGDDKEQGDLGFEYKTSSVAVTGECDIILGSSASASACLTKGDINVGASGKFDIKKSSLSAYSLGGSYAVGPLFASVTTKKLSSANLGFLYKVNSDLSIATSSSHSASSPLSSLTLGMIYAAPVALIKAKVTSDGIIEAAAVKDIAKKVTINPAIKVAAKNPTETFSYGLGVTMG